MKHSAEKFTNNLFSFLNFQDGDNDEGIQLHILQCLSAYYHFQRAKSGNEREMKSAKFRIFWRTISEMCLNVLDLDQSLDVTKSNTALDHLTKLFFDDRVSSNGKGWLPLHCASVSNATSEKDLQLIATQLKSCGDETVVSNADRITPWHLAAAIHQPNMTIIRRLKKFYPMFARSEDINKRLPLHYCAKYSNSVTMLQELLQAFPGGILKQDCDGNSALHGICKNPTSEAVDMLNTLLVACPKASRIQNKTGHLPLHTICQYNMIKDRVSMIASLIEAYPEGAGRTDSSGDTPLHKLLKSPQDDIEDLVLMFLKVFPATAMKQDEAGRLPLHQACSVELEEIARLHIITALLDVHPEGATVPAKMGVLPLHLAVKSGVDIAIIKLLVTAYPEALSAIADGPIFETYGTPLHISAWGSRVDISLYLYSLEHDAIHTVDSEGWTVLHASACSPKSNFNMFKTIYELDKEAISARTNSGDSLLITIIANDPNFSSVSDAADKFRFVLHKDPGSVYRVNKIGQSPYSLCSSENTYARRLLLRSNHRSLCMKIDDLYSLNYAARRMAMFLFFAAARCDGKDTLFTKFRDSVNDLSIIRHIVEYL